MATETNWTPGPWAVDHYRDGEKLRARIVQDDGHLLKRILVNVPNWFLDGDEGCDEHVEFEANMALIAAAPDLYAALADMTQWVAAFARGHGVAEHRTVTNSPRYRKARAALAKVQPLPASDQRVAG